MYSDALNELSYHIFKKSHQLPFQNVNNPTKRVPRDSAIGSQRAQELLLESANSEL